MTSATRIIQTLGGHGIVRKRAASYGAVVDRVRSGLPYAALEAVATRYGMSQEAVVRVLRLPLRTLGRRKKDGRLSPDESDRLLRLARIGAIVFYTGRLLQALAMWVLLVDIFMAGPMGPQPNPFYAGVAMFIIGWFMVRRTARSG